MGDGGSAKLMWVMRFEYGCGIGDILSVMV